uniref:Uncharacterized protein n=1 Tax=Anguilla anguilla TaxID=7936 RepID=A0A0E9QNW6_ANGAN
MSSEMPTDARDGHYEYFSFFVVKLHNGRETASRYTAALRRELERPQDSQHTVSGSSIAVNVMFYL